MVRQFAALHTQAPIKTSPLFSAFHLPAFVSKSAQNCAAGLAP